MAKPHLNSSNKKVLSILILSQFLCTSIWFATNGIIDKLKFYFVFDLAAQGHLTSAVQFGFICGTLFFAILTIPDRYSPSRVFFVSACLAAMSNLGILLETNNLFSLIVFRFLSGVFLAGIYPVGMKIAADYFENKLGKSLGYLVGALVLGTALPHLLGGWSIMQSWKDVIILTSGLSILGGIMVLVLIPDGPYRKAGSGINLSAFIKVFKNRPFRLAAFGYFGHMWELYAFWAFVPLILQSYSEIQLNPNINISLWSFLIIGVGAMSCAVGGHISEVIGNKKTALSALIISGVCCVLFPFCYQYMTQWGFLVYLLIWGIAVIADSPQLSTMVANNANPNLKGTALTIVNCTGFAITIVSIQLLNYLQFTWSISLSMLILGLGPLFGIIALIKDRYD